MSYCSSSSIIMMPERLQSFTNMLPGSATAAAAASVAAANSGLPGYSPSLPAQPQLHSSLVGASPQPQADENNNSHGVLKMCGTQHPGSGGAGGGGGGLVNAIQNFKKMESIHHHHHQNDMGKDHSCFLCFIFVWLFV